MFYRIFIIKFKELIRMRWLVGWNFLFPLVLASAFYLGFGNLIKSESGEIKAIKVAYVEESNSENLSPLNNPFLLVLTDLSSKTDSHDQILELYKYDNFDQAVSDLNSVIDGIYYQTNDDIKVYVSENGINATTLTQILKSYKNYSSTFQRIQNDKAYLINDSLDLILNDISFLKKHVFNPGVSEYMQYFYALLAMSSLFASWISTAMMQSMCANLSDCGKRFEMAPVHKLSAILAGILAGTLIQSMSNCIVVLYIEYVLKLSFGAPIYLVIAITSLASALGISIGVLIGSIFRNPLALSMVPLAVSMVCSFFSGLMMGGINQIIQNVCPLLNKINPATVFTDSLYQLSCYGKTTAYYQDLAIMFFMIILFLFVSTLLLRRRNYDSI